MFHLYDGLVERLRFDLIYPHRGCFYFESVNFLLCFNDLILKCQRVSQQDQALLANLLRVVVRKAELKKDKQISFCFTCYELKFTSKCVKETKSFLIFSVIGKEFLDEVMHFIQKRHFS